MYQFLKDLGSSRKVKVITKLDSTVMEMSSPTSISSPRAKPRTYLLSLLNSIFFRERTNYKIARI